MEIYDFKKHQIKRMSAFDWGLVKIAAILFGIMLVVYYPSLASWLEWYWWLLLALIFAMPLFLKAYGGNVRLKDNSMMGRFRYAKKESPVYFWGMVKVAQVFFGITIVTFYPEMIGWLEWYWWGLLVLIIMAIPVYYIYEYAPRTEKKPTSMSKVRLKYTRRKVKW